MVFVPVALVQMMFSKVDGMVLDTVRLVTYRFVVVAFVDVTFAK